MTIAVLRHVDARETRSAGVPRFLPHAYAFANALVLNVIRAFARRRARIATGCVSRGGRLARASRTDFATNDREDL